MEQEEPMKKRGAYFSPLFNLVQVTIENAGQLKHGDLILAKKSSKLVIGQNIPPIPRILQIISSDVAPKLLDRLCSGNGSRSNNRSQIRRRLHRAHESLIGLSIALLFSCLLGSCLASGCLLGSCLASGCLLGSCLASGCLLGGLFASSRLLGGLFASGCLSGSFFASGCLFGSLLASGCLSGSFFASGCLFGSLLASGYLSGSLLPSGCLFGSLLASCCLTSCFFSHFQFLRKRLLLLLFQIPVYISNYESTKTKK